jgi:GntR family transcriptional regulator/MocR family aminotransferase
MSKSASSFELTVGERPGDKTLTRWLHEELRHAILDGRLRPGARLPATRDFAGQYGVSRGTAVTVFEELAADGYLRCEVVSGTWVNELIPAHTSGPAKYCRERPSPPAPLTGLTFPEQARPFRLHEPALEEFPLKVWTRVAGRRMRKLSPAMLVAAHPGGYGPLREAIADYLGSVRGVKCHPDQIVVTSGVQQALDLLARLLLRPDDPVWIEDPGYFGAALAFQNAGARIVPVPMDQQGISVSEGRRISSRAKCAYVTPAHQFPLGVTMSIQRRVELLAWASEADAFIIEDDYDSEFRFEGRPVPALQGLDRHGSVILLGTFNKLLFPALRLGYAVLPPALVDRFLAFRYGTDLHGTGLDQAVLCDFIVEGHLGRHIRRMRELYGGRLAALLDGGQRYLGGLLDISRIQAGLYTAGFLRNGMSSQQAETAASARAVETIGFHRFTLGTNAVDGLLLGFAAFDNGRIRRGLLQLAAALDNSTTASPIRTRTSGRAQNSPLR